MSALIQASWWVALMSPVECGAVWEAVWAKEPGLRGKH